MVEGGVRELKVPADVLYWLLHEALDSASLRLLAKIDEEGEVTVSSASKLFRDSQISAANKLIHLLYRGLVETVQREGRVYWRLTELGRKVLAIYRSL